MGARNVGGSFIWKKLWNQRGGMKKGKKGITETNGDKEEGSRGGIEKNRPSNLGLLGGSGGGGKRKYQTDKQATDEGTAEGN